MKKFIKLFTIFSFLLIGMFTINAQSDTLADTTLMDTSNNQEMAETYELSLIHI